MLIFCLNSSGSLNWHWDNNMFAPTPVIYSGVPNSQVRLTIDAVEKIPGVLSFVAIDIV